MRILTVAMGVPFPPLGGGLSRTFHLLRALAPHHDLVLAAFTYGSPHEPPPFPIRIESVPWQWSSLYQEMTSGAAEAAQRAFDSLAYHADEPWFASCLDPSRMEEALRRIVRGGVDIALIEGTPNAAFLRALPWDVPCVLDLLDVHSLIAQRAAERADTGTAAAPVHEARRTIRFEKAAVERCDVCVAVSEVEASAARDLLGARNVRVVPNGVDTSLFKPSRNRPRAGAILFTGMMSYEPNVEAICDFVTAVLPVVRRAVPHARLDVVGMNPPARVTNLSSPSVVVHGRVPDVRPYQEEAEVVVVPVRCGGGTRLKVLEAAACGKAIVSTPLGIEGLDFRRGEDLLVAESRADFADATVALLLDPALRARLGARARDVACRYDWASIGEHFRAVVEEAAAARSKRGAPPIANQA